MENEQRRDELKMFARSVCDLLESMEEQLETVLRSDVMRELEEELASLERVGNGGDFKRLSSATEAVWMCGGLWRGNLRFLLDTIGRELKRQPDAEYPWEVPICAGLGMGNLRSVLDTIGTALICFEALPYLVTDSE